MAKKAAKTKHKAKAKAEVYPMHFIGFEGKQGTDDYRAFFSTKPKAAKKKRAAK